MKRIIALIVIILLGVVYYRFNPSDSSLFPKCPFYVLTGYKCPGCGSQRALHHLLHLDIADAFRSNALLVLSLPMVSILMYAECKREKKPGLYMKVNSQLIIWSCFTFVTLWWVLRNFYDL